MALSWHCHGTMALSWPCHGTMALSVKYSEDKETEALVLAHAAIEFWHYLNPWITKNMDLNTISHFSNVELGALTLVPNPKYEKLILFLHFSFMFHSFFLH